MCSGSEADSYLRLIDFMYHSTLGLRVIEKKKKFNLGPVNSFLSQIGSGRADADWSGFEPDQLRQSCPSALLLLFFITLKPRVE